MTTHPVDVRRPVDAPVPSRRYVLVADDSAEMRGLPPLNIDRLLASVRRLVTANAALSDGMLG